MPTSLTSAASKDTAVFSCLFFHLINCETILREVVLSTFGSSNAKAMSDSKVHSWVRAFKDGRDNAYDESRSGRPSAITDLVDAVESSVKTSDSQFPL
jgi:hypothetical protein